MVEFVYFDSVFMTGHEWVGFVVGGVELVIESAEQHCHRQVGFAVAEVCCGVNEYGVGVAIDEVVAAP